jgi:hypothetical protein
VAERRWPYCQDARSSRARVRYSLSTVGKRPFNFLIKNKKHVLRDGRLYQSLDLDITATWKSRLPRVQKCAPSPRSAGAAEPRNFTINSNFRNRKTNFTKLNAETKFTSLTLCPFYIHKLCSSIQVLCQSRAMASHTYYIQSSFSTYLRHGVILTERLCFCIS